jgi:hypothetical protein
MSNHSLFSGVSGVSDGPTLAGSPAVTCTVTDSGWKFGNVSVTS